MIDKKQMQNINSFLQKRVVQRFSVVAVALVVVGSVAYFGANNSNSSQAAGVGTLSVTPATGTFTTGSNVSVTISEDSGTDPVNSVQASLRYDATKLQYVSMTEGTAFSTIAATSTATAGTIRVGRATAAGSSVTGNNAVVTVTFRVLGNTGTTALNFDPAFSFIVRSTDSVNILTSSTTATYAMKLPTPAISAVSPASGSIAGGTALTITGSNFVSGATVSVGGAAATAVTFVSATSITATAPAHAAGVVTVAVTNPDGQVASRASGFTYFGPAPTITTVTPTSGLPTGGTSVTIAGTNFVAGASVKFGGLNATNVIVTATSITATTPARAAGTADVVVTNPDGQSATKLAGYTYRLPAPTVTSVSPTRGLVNGGTVVTITGTNFVSGATVMVGNAAATTVTFVSATSIRATTSAQPAGVVTVAVTNPDGQRASLASGYTYVNSAPTISGVSPTSGAIGGGTTVTVTGTNFTSGATVKFGAAVSSSVTFVSATTLTVLAPAGVAGPSQVVVTNPDGQSTAGTAPVFTYLSNPGDANNDGRVNAIDLSIILSRDAQNYPPADFNGDGTVGSADMAILLGRWTW
ncbi:MAG TPA: IPT/TIG domain-containing protein [Candidatus Saccharimonadales bacterium]|jgi:hypothetical protein